MSKKEVKKVDQSVLYNLCHEIRTPLCSLMGLNQLMEKNIENVKELRGYIEESRITLDYMNSLVNSILDMSQTDSGHILESEQTLSLKEILYNLKHMMRERILEKQIQFQVHADWKHVYIIGNKLCIEQVLVNILENAIKFTPNGGKILFDVTQEITAQDRISTTFQITDTGCGISEEFKSHIFDLLSQERRAENIDVPGTGLGMAISYHLIKEMGGEIHVDSKLGEGSCFTVVLPAWMSEERVEALYGAAMEQIEPVISRKNILVAEDNRINAKILTEILKAGGCRVTWVGNGQKVLNVFKSSEINEIDVILLDLKMPVMDGFETAQAIRSLERSDADSVRIYACTANTFSAERKKVLESGMNGIIEKPIQTQKLFELVNGDNTEK